MKLANKWVKKEPLQMGVPVLATAGLQQDNQDRQDEQDIQDSHDGVWWVGVVERHLPKAARQTDKLLWALARDVKRPGIEWDEYCRVFDCWRTKANPAFLNSTKDYLAEFLRKACTVKHAKGATLLSALHAAKQATPPAEVAMTKNATACLLASLCRELQRRAGPHKAFFVGSDVVGKALGVTHTTVSNWLGAFCGDVFRLLKKTKQGSRGKGANEYLYLGGMD